MMTRMRSLRTEDGFSLIEILATVLLLGILLTVSAGSIRTYWLVQSVDSTTDEILAQLRQVQERVVSETHPLVYGVRFGANSTSYDVVRYNPAAATGSKCSYVDRRNTADGMFAGGARILAPSFPMDAASPELAACRSDLGLSGGDQIVFFYARGSAVAGSLTVSHPGLPSTSNETITVIGITGRVGRT